MVAAPITIVEAPSGSTAIEIPPFAGPFLITTTALNSLANDSSSSALSYSNSPGTTNASVFITLNSITPTSGAKIQIISGVDGYEMSISTTTGGKYLTFINIPTSFLSSFTVKNLSGVTLASSNNYVTIAPEYI